jgi:hypothetical protein
MGYYSINFDTHSALVLQGEAGLFAMPAVEQGVQVQSEGHPESIDEAVSLFLLL